MDNCPECGSPRIDFALDGRAMCNQRHLWTSAEIEAAVDPSLPPGVIQVSDADGKWWHYPLTELEEEA